MMTDIWEFSSGHAVLEEYPLPIAHKVGLLEEARGWWDKCRQLRDVVDYSLRYATLLVLSDHLRGESNGDATLKKMLLARLVSPRPEHLYRLFREIMTRYRDRREELMVPELYDFCYTPEGTPTAEMRRVRRLLDAFVAPVDDQQVGRGDVGQLQDLWETHEPDVERLLRDLSFLKQYELLRVDRIRSAGDGYTWQVKVLMGQHVPAEREQREGMPELKEQGVVLWDGERKRVLVLHPFALFDECEKCKEAFEPPPVTQELFLYEETAENGDIGYVGIRESDGLTHRMRTGDTASDFRFVLQVEFWPLGDEESVPSEMDWRRYRGLAKTRSREQLEQYRKAKYRSSVYLRREMVESDLQKFLEGERNGFLVVGDSGTGKTSLLCHWVDNLLEEGEDVVLFSNCAELPAELAAGEDVNLGSVVAQRLGKHADFAGLLRDLERMRGEGNGRFVLVLDALNEHQAPQALLESLWQDLLSQVPAGMYDWFKVVVSCRTEAWRRLEQHFRGVGQFYRTDDGVEVRLPQFTEDELPDVYGKYQRSYDLKANFSGLTDTARRFIADPLMLRFVAEGYRGQELPRDPRSVDVFDSYYRDKVGDGDDAQMDRLEKAFVSRLVELMYQARTDELSERALSGDEQIGQAVLASHDVNSPYFRLLDKGVVTRVQVGRRGYGAAALFGGGPAEPETRVQFTYDRFFEYLLAYRVIPGEPTEQRVRELLAQAETHRYQSLWGALKARLLGHLERAPAAASPSGVIAQLARDADHSMRGLLGDLLIAYGQQRPSRTAVLLTETLLRSDSESSGLVVIIAGHQLEMPEVLRQAFLHPSALVSQMAMQTICFYCTKHPQEGDVLLDQLSREAGEELIRAVPSQAWRRVRGEDLELADLNAFNFFLGVGLQLCFVLMAEPEAGRRLARMWLKFYEGFPRPLRGLAIGQVKSFFGNALVQAHAYNPLRGPITLDTLSIFARRPLNSPVRAKLRKCAEYLLAEEETKQIADELFEMAQIRDGAVSLVILGILINHILVYPEQALDLLKRIYSEGDRFSKYNVIRAMSMALQVPGVPRSHYDFFSEAVLGVWVDQEPLVDIEGQHYTLGHLDWPMVHECREKRRGKLDFVDRFMAQPWREGRTSQICFASEYLARVGIFAFFVKDIRPLPILDTLRQWFHYQGDDETETERVRRAVANALAYTWISSTDEVEFYLEDEPEYKMMMFEALETDQVAVFSRGALNNLMSAVLVVPEAAAGFVKVIQRICDEVTDASMALRLVGAYIMDASTWEAMAEDA